jgi:hypothetical protein
MFAAAATANRLNPRTPQNPYHGEIVPQSFTTQNNNSNCNSNNVIEFVDSVNEFKTNFIYENVIKSLSHLETCGILTFDENIITFAKPNFLNPNNIAFYNLINGNDAPKELDIDLKGFGTSFHKLLYSLCTENERSDNIDEIKKIRIIADQFNQQFGEYGTIGVAVRQGYRRLTTGGKRTKRKRTKARRIKSRRTKTSRRK